MATDFDWTKFQTQGQESGEPVPVNTTQFDYNKFQQAQEQSGQPPAGLEDTKALSFATGFANVVNKLSTGIINKVMPGNSAVNTSRDFVRHATELSKNINPISTSLGEVTGEIAKTAPLVAATGGMGALANIAATTGGSAALGYLDNPEEVSRGTNALYGAAGGLIGSALGTAVQGIVKALPKAKIAKFASESGKNVEAENAAKNLGIELSPFETTKSINLAKAPLQKIKMNPDRAAKLDAALVEREGKLTDVLNTTLQKVAPNKELESKIYTELGPRQIPEEIVSKIVPKEGSKELSYVQNLYKEAHDTTSSKIDFSDVKPGSFEDLKTVRGYIQGKIDANSKSDNPLSGAAVHSLNSAKKKLTEAMYSVSSKEELPVAEQLAKQSGFMKYVDDKIAKIGLKGAGQDSPTPIQIYKKLFGTTAAKKNFYSKLDNALSNHPEKEAIKQTFKDWEKVMNQLQDSPLDKLVGKNQFASGVPVAELGKATVAGFATGSPDIGAAAFGLGAANKMMSSKGYFNQIWKPLPEAAVNPGQTAKQVIQGGGLLTGQEAGG